MEALAHKKKKFSINFSKSKAKFCFSLHYNGCNNYLFVNGKEIYKFKVNNGNVNFPSQFCLGIISNKFNYVEVEEMSFKEKFMFFQSITMLLINLTY